MKKILEYGMYLLVFLLPWQTVWIIQEAAIGPAGAVGVWQYGTLKVYAIEVLILFLAVISLLCYWNSNGVLFCVQEKCRKVRQTGLLAERLGMAVLIFAGLSIFWSEERLVALFAWVRLLEGALLFYFFKSAQLRFSWFSIAWISSAVIQSALGIWQFIAQDISANSLLGIAAHNPLDLGTSVIEAGDRRWLRAYGGFPHPNIFGAYLAISIVWCAAALSRSREKWHWFILIASSQVILIVLLLTFSRSAWLALIAAALAASIFSLRRKRESSKLSFPRKRESSPFIYPIAALAIVSIITISIFSTFFFEEIQTRVGFAKSRLESQSMSERITSFSRAAPLLRETWFAGTGIGNFTNTLFRFEEQNGIVQPWHTYQPMHNVFALVFAELGAIGIILFLLALTFAVRMIRNSSLLIIGPSLLIAFFMLSVFDHFFWTLPFGIFMLALAFGASYRRGS